MDNVELKALIDMFALSPLTDLEVTCPAYSVKMKQDNGVDKTGKKPASLPDCLPDHGGTLTSQENQVVIASPTVRTFLLAPAPDAPPYVEVGDKVEKGSVMCTIEAMKLMNQLEADFSCELVSILASQGSLVEFGQPLFKVKRR
jgi:acetyl-CoA carboxylase biotin carboxyl carrier protein